MIRGVNNKAADVELIAQPGTNPLLLVELPSIKMNQRVSKVIDQEIYYKGYP